MFRVTEFSTHFLTIEKLLFLFPLLYSVILFPFNVTPRRRISGVVFCYYMQCFIFCSLLVFCFYFHQLISEHLFPFKHLFRMKIDDEKKAPERMDCAAQHTKNFCKEQQSGRVFVQFYSLFNFILVQWCFCFRFLFVLFSTFFLLLFGWCAVRCRALF